MQIGKHAPKPGFLWKSALESTKTEPWFLGKAKHFTKKNARSDLMSNWLGLNTYTSYLPGLWIAHFKAIHRYLLVKTFVFSPALGFVIWFHSKHTGRFTDLSGCVPWDLQAQWQQWRQERYWKQQQVSLQDEMRWRMQRMRWRSPEWPG